MRQIKFRYWNGSNMFEVKRIVFSNVDNDRLYQLEGYYKDSFVPKKSQIGGLSTSDTSLIMQYTGLKDKNGVEIYEGDIVVEYYPGGNECCRGEVYWLDELAGFHTTTREPDEWDDSPIINNNKNYEVIGNIYENPELLEDKK